MAWARGAARFFRVTYAGRHQYVQIARSDPDGAGEGLFERGRDLFTALVFFDTTSLYFAGRGGQTLGRYGHSKDHARDRRQMIVGIALNSAGWPLRCELWPGNTTDVKTLLPAVERELYRQTATTINVCWHSDHSHPQARNNRPVFEMRNPPTLIALTCQQFFRISHFG